MQAAQHLPPLRLVVPSLCFFFDAKSYNCLQSSLQARLDHLLEKEVAIGCEGCNQRIPIQLMKQMVTIVYGGKKA